MKELWSLTRRCYSHQQASPLPDDRYGGSLVRIYNCAGDREVEEPMETWEPNKLLNWEQAMSASSIEEMRRNRWMAISGKSTNTAAAADGGDFYDDIFGGSNSNWIKSSPPSSSRFDDWEDHGLRSRSSRLLATFPADEAFGVTLGSFSSKLRYLPSLFRPLVIPTRWSSSSPTTTLSNSSKEAKIKNTIQLKLDNGISNELYNQSPPSMATPQDVNRKLTEKNNKKALEEFEKAIVVDMDDLYVDGATACEEMEEEDDDKSMAPFVIELVGGRGGSIETTMVVDEEIAWVRERFMADSGQKEAEEQADSI